MGRGEVMTMEQFFKIISADGLPVLISGVVIYLLWKIGDKVPTIVKTYLDARLKMTEDQQERYETLQAQLGDQIKVITTVAQQGVETQRRSNEVIERNNMLIEANQRVIEKITNSMDRFWDVTREIRADVKEGNQLSQKLDLEMIRLCEITRKCEP